MDPARRDPAVIVERRCDAQGCARRVGIEHVDIRPADRLGVAAHAPDRGDEVAQLGDVVGRPALVVRMGFPQGGLGRREAESPGGDGLGERERIDRIPIARLSGPAAVGGHSSTPLDGRTSASIAATFLSPRWTSVRAVTAGTPMTVAMSAYSRSSWKRR